MYAAPIDVGQTVAEKYQIIELIGSGGMANVWLARDERLGKLWAIKEIKPNTQGTRGEIFRQALVDEANLMKRFDHPAIPRVVDILDTGATTFVVMDYVDGSSLDRLLRLRGKPFDQDDAIAWGVLLCDVLDYLHRLVPSVVYRDLKPANIILRDDGSVRLVDFGIALDTARGDASGTRVLGTPGYAAPEQLTCAHDVDGRADVYSLGVTLYVLVTGHTPKLVHRGGSSDVAFDMKPIRSWNAHLSEGLERVILRATCQNPQERYQSMREMRYDLEHHEELTQRWRDEQQQKINAVRRRAIAAGICAAVGVACLLAGHAVRSRSYVAIMHEAQTAPRSVTGDGPSEAEVLVNQAMCIDGSTLETYRLLLDIYEDDYRLSDGEARRLQKALGTARALEDDPGYVQFCFDVGMCYLSYYDIDKQGGSVGTAAVASIDAAAPWFERVLTAQEKGEDTGHGRLSESDVRSATMYKSIAGFFDAIRRASMEGRSAEDAYRSFWHALDESLSYELASDDAHKSVEGLRARLCQVAAEVLASPTYLAGMARSGVSAEEADALSQKVRACMEDLKDFFLASDSSYVYAPVYDELIETLELVEQNRRIVYANSAVRRDDREEQT